MMMNNNHPPILEITVISAQDLIRTSSLAFSRRLRPFVTLTATSTTTTVTTNHTKICKTRVDEKGGVNPTWGDKFQLCLDHNFFYQRYPGIYLQLYTKHLLMGQSQLGWCLIPAADIVSQFHPVGSTRSLSYRLRARDGTRGHGVVNVAVKLEGSLAIVHPPREFGSSNAPYSQEMHESEEIAIGIPVTL